MGASTSAAFLWDQSFGSKFDQEKKKRGRARPSALNPQPSGPLANGSLGVLQAATEGASSFYGVTLQQAELSLRKMKQTPANEAATLKQTLLTNTIKYERFEKTNCCSLAFSYTISARHFPQNQTGSSFLHLVPTLKTLAHPHLIRKLVMFPVIIVMLPFRYMERAVFSHTLAGRAAKAPSCLQLIHILLTLPLSLSDELEFLHSAVLIKPKANTSTHYPPTHVSADNELAH